MPGTVDIEFLEKARSQIGALVTEDARKLPNLRYCDVRMQVKEEKGAAAENGVEKMSAEDYTFDFGVRVIAGAKASAPGYYGRLLGNADVDNIAQVVMEGIKEAHQRATANARMKVRSRDRFGSLADSLYDTQLAPVSIVEDSVTATYEQDPREVSLEETVRMAVDSCRARRVPATRSSCSARGPIWWAGGRPSWAGPEKTCWKPSATSDRPPRRHRRPGRHESLAGGRSDARTLTRSAGVRDPRRLRR